MSQILPRICSAFGFDLLIFNIQDNAVINETLKQKLWDSTWAKLWPEEGSPTNIGINLGDRGVPGSTWSFPNETLRLKKVVINQSYLLYSYLFMLGVGGSVSAWVNDTQVMVAIRVAIYSYHTRYNQNALQSHRDFSQLLKSRGQEILTWLSQSHLNEWPIWTEWLIMMAECPQIAINMSKWHTHPFIGNIHAFDRTSPNGTHYSYIHIIKPIPSHFFKTLSLWGEAWSCFLERFCKVVMTVSLSTNLFPFSKNCFHWA